jgi:hypothetical protein
MDPDWLDGAPSPELLARFARSEHGERTRLEAIYRQLPPPADDFVRLPLPQVAGSSRGAVRAAVREYEQAAKVVDARLFRKVTLQVKGVSLASLCALLKGQTGVDLQASRGIADEKVTVFVQERPAREVMREVARLFNALWARSGEEERYRYELGQDLKSQLAEEELRNADFRAALLALDAEMEKYRPYLDLNAEQLRQRLQQVERGDKQRVFTVGDHGWGGIQLYRRLTAAERAALVAGQDLIYGPDMPNPDRRIPEGWQQRILELSSSSVLVGGRRLAPKDVPGIEVSRLFLSLRRSEMGRLTLKSSETLTYSDHGRTYMFYPRVLATGRSPSVANPENAALNQALKGKPPFDQVVTLAVQPSCPHFAANAARERPEGQEQSYVDANGTHHQGPMPPT